MKNKFLLTITAMCLSVMTFAQINLPLPSSAGNVTSTVGLTEVEIDYFRPKMKSRKIFGEGQDFLVPFGKIWRSGANSGTVIRFEDDVTIQGESIKGGEYLLFSIPGANEWTLMLYSDLSLGGNTAGYDESKEAGRFTVKAENLNQTVETFTMNIGDIADDNTSAAIELSWEKTSVKLPFEVNFDKKVMESIEANLQVPAANYLAAANYYYQTDRDIDQAIEWMSQYLESNGNQFWNIHLLAQMQKKKGDYEAARATAEKSMNMAKSSGNDFGYIKLNQDLIDSLPKGKKKKKK